jgi:hypothetical protein
MATVTVTPTANIEPVKSWPKQAMPDAPLNLTGIYPTEHKVLVEQKAA